MATTHSNSTSTTKPSPVGAKLDEISPFAPEPDAAAHDLLVQARVLDAFARDEELAGLDVDVSVEDGSVTLLGEVPDERTRERLGRVTAAQDGVLGVANLLTIDPRNPDPWIEPDIGDEGSAKSEFIDDDAADAEVSPTFKTKDAL